MTDQIRKLIESTYNLKIRHISPGPRGFVAETFILEVETGEKYFAKILNHDKYTQPVIESLSIIEQLHASGLKNINYPIETTNGELYLLERRQIIVLFNYIEAIQSFEFNNEEFGRLIGHLHQKTSQITAPIAVESFDLIYIEDFEKAFRAGLKPAKNDSYTLEMSAFLKEYQTEIEADWQELQRIIPLCKRTSFQPVITHGDAPGNILIDQKGAIYLIDWDTILLAPAERDTWFLKDVSSFIKGYKSVFPDYQLNPLFYKFYLYKRWTEDLQGYIEEIISHKSAKHKEKNLMNLENNYLEWMRPLIRALD